MPFALRSRERSAATLPSTDAFAAPPRRGTQSIAAGAAILVLLTAGPAMAQSPPDPGVPIDVVDDEVFDGAIDEVVVLATTGGELVAGRFIAWDDVEVTMLVDHVVRRFPRSEIVAFGPLTSVVSEAYREEAHVDTTPRSTRPPTPVIEGPTPYERSMRRTGSTKRGVGLGLTSLGAVTMCMGALITPFTYMSYATGPVMLATGAALTGTGIYLIVRGDREIQASYAFSPPRNDRPAWGALRLTF